MQNIEVSHFAPLISACKFELGPELRPANMLNQRLHSYGDVAETVLEPTIRVALKTLQDAELMSHDIDVIASLSLSPNRVAYERDVCAPRLCHPIQKELNASNAWCFDAVDSSIDRVIQIVWAYLESTKKNYGLIVRGELCNSLRACKVSEFHWSEGAAAILVTRDITRAKWQMSGHQSYKLEHGPFCYILWNENIQSPDDHLGLISFPQATEFFSKVKNVAAEKGLFESAEIESWLGSNENRTQAGPFELFRTLSEKPKLEAFQFIHMNPMRSEWSVSHWQPVRSEHV